MNAARPSVVWLATLAVVVAVVVLLREILLPFVAGFALAYLLNPVVNRLERIGVNRAVAALGTVGLFIIGVGVLMVLAGRSAWDSVFIPTLNQCDGGLDGKDRTRREALTGNENRKVDGTAGTRRGGRRYQGHRTQSRWAHQALTRVSSFARIQRPPLGLALTRNNI